jgi:hypothetical protein
MSAHRSLKDIQQFGLLSDAKGIPLDFGTTVPPDGATGYMESAIFQRQGGANANERIYINNGDETSAAFIAMTLEA